MKTLTVYSKDNCAACATVISYLKTQQANFIVLKLGEAFDINYIREKFPDAKQFPIVVMNDNVGGPIQEISTGNAALPSVKQFLVEA